jgi:aryl-alcohol dehydrogenase-like predicted oxidoreductase
VLEQVAKDQNVSMAQVALAWVKDRPNVGPLVIGARNETQLRDNLAAADLDLTPEQNARIESVARPAPIYPFWHRAMHNADRAAATEVGYLLGHRQTLGRE